MNNIVALEKNVSAGKRVQAIVPQSMDEAFTLAKAICRAGMAPRGMDTPEKAMIAIMRGMEVGLTPMMALDKIAIVNGRPTIWGDGAIGLVRASGLVEFIKEYFEGSGDQRVAVCEAKRRGEPEPVVRKFSIAEAKKARLWGKSGPWQDYPDRMLQMRARGFALRDAFADVLGGLYLKEEWDGVEEESVPPASDTVIDNRSVIEGEFTHESLTLSKAQVDELDALIKEVGADKAKFLAYCDVTSLEELGSVHFENAKKTLNAKKAKEAKNG